MTDNQAKAVTRDSLVRYFGRRSPRSNHFIKLYKAVGNELFVWHAWNLKWGSELPRHFISAAKLTNDWRMERVSREEARKHERHCANHLLRQVQDWMRDNPE